MPLRRPLCRPPYRPHRQSTICPPAQLPPAHLPNPLLYSQHIELGEALIAFFGYFADEFPFETHAVSVRLGAPLPRTPAAPSALAAPSFAWRTFGVEDPLEMTRDLGAGLTDASFALTRAELRRASALLREQAAGQAGGPRVPAGLPPPPGRATRHSRTWPETFAQLLEPRMA